MVTELPIINYKGKKYFVDFRLEELREVKGLETIKFRDIKGNHKTTKIKIDLRRLRFREYGQYFMEGLDN